MSEAVATKTALEEILDAIKKEHPHFIVTMEKHEDEQAYFKRIAEAVNVLSGDGWNSLTETGGQAWFNAASQATNGMLPLPPIPGFQTTFIPPTEEKKKEDKKMETATEKKPTGKRGVMNRARELALLNPEADSVKITEMLTAEGWPTSADTVWTCVQEVKNVLKAVESCGLSVVKGVGVK